MNIHFSNYRFCCDTLTLFQQEDIVSLKHTQALLLNFFLVDPKGIHSKDAIMNAVWKDKVVSEQVVFQTISQLRAIFGTQAIKTFSKKGYQWQLPVSQAPIMPPDNAVAHYESTKTDDIHDNSPERVKKSPFILLLLIAVVAISFYVFQSHSAKSKAAINFVISDKPIVSNQPSLSELIHEKINQNDKFTTTLVSSLSSVRQSFLAPEHVWKRAKLPENEWLSWSETFSSPKGIFLHYALSRGAVYWSGYLYAETHEQLVEKYVERLNELRQLGIFSMTNRLDNIDELTAMIGIAPDDPDVLLLLANYYLDNEQFDLALTYTKMLENKEAPYETSPYLAQAHALMAEIYKGDGKYALVVKSLQAMSLILEDTPLWSLSFENIRGRAWLAYKMNNFDEMFTVLDEGLTFAQEQDDVLTLFEMHMMYSILAKKGGDNEKKYNHLNEAQALLLKHKLDESNFAVVYLHFAIFTQDKAKELPYLEKILTLPRTTHNSWIIDDATERLIDQYINLQEYTLAILLLNHQTESPKYMLSWARIYLARNNEADARNYFEKAFILARADNNRRVAISAALALFKLISEQPKLQAEYYDYLKNNANDTWLNEQMNMINEG